MIFQYESKNTCASYFLHVKKKKKKTDLMTTDL